MTKRKRKSKRLPPHIVLPNGMWRFVKRGKKTKRRGAKVARRRYRASARRRRSSSGLGGGKLMRGLFPVRGLVAGALVGIGAAMLQQRFLPQVIPYQGAAAGFVVGGIPGAAAAFLTGSVGSSVAISQGVTGYQY